MRQKKGYKVGLALALVLAVATSLWFASPVTALEVNFPSLPSSGTLGTTYSFTISIDISDEELLPIQNVNLDIYNSINPTTYKASCTDMPLTSTSKSYTSTETGGGAVDVIATVSNLSYGYGYGYAGWKGTPYYFGYGYGYGYGGGATSITYSVDWTPPSGWPAGSYKIDVKITANSTTFTQTSDGFTLSAPPAGAPGGGGGGGATGVTNVFDIITEAGRFIEDITAPSADGKVKLYITRNTIGKTKGGLALWRIIIRELATPPASPADARLIGLVYNITPDGATFAPPVTLTFAYDPALIPQGFAEEDLALAWWDEAAGKWIKLVSTVDVVNHIVSAQISHFTPFAVFAYPHPLAFTITNLVISPTEVEAGKTVTISAVVTNPSDLSGSYQVVFKINNAVVATQDITVAAGASQKVTFTVAKDVAGTYAVDVNGLLGTFMVKVPPPVPPKPAVFTPSDLSISPTEVEPGKVVAIGVLVTNTGGMTGTYEVTLKADNVVVATESVTLAAGASQKVAFAISKDVPGTYTVDVNGLKGTFTVKALPPPPKPMINWWLIGSIIALAIIIGVALSIYYWRRRALPTE
jgi:hypothetical protein